jgi:hypothetical protein
MQAKESPLLIKINKKWWITVNLRCIYLNSEINKNYLCELKLLIFIIFLFSVTSICHRFVHSPSLNLPGSVYLSHKIRMETGMIDSQTIIEGECTLYEIK